jgi:hypothetical protein
MAEIWVGNQSVEPKKMKQMDMETYFPRTITCSNTDLKEGGKKREFHFEST